MGSPETPPDGAVLHPDGPATDPTEWDDDDSTVMTESLAAGSFFGDRFRLGTSLGSGAMGRVMQALDLQEGGEVALKLLHRERARDAEALERFRREAAILQAIGHPAIVRVVAMGAAPDGTPWLAMELLRGETLKQRLFRGPFEPRALVPLLNALCDALEAAHTRGVVHRDLKPENVLLTESGDPPCKLLDFGLSRFTANKTLTRSGTILGTPRYMAPEQIRSASSADLRVDVFSVGVLLYEMLTARSPYPADDLGQLLGCVLEGRTVPLAQLRPDLPPAVGVVIARAMARLPADRFQTAGAIAEAYATSIGMSSGRSMLRSAPELTASPERSAFPQQEEGSSPLVDPFAAAAAARVSGTTSDDGAGAELARHPLLATVAPGTFGAPPVAPPAFIGAGARVTP
ncbi:MAG: serine/threonine protein kinase, partial [Myxococcota bacterium]|nr:serine/threonine protein kinase [Myxococcota bacterium]